MNKQLVRVAVLLLWCTSAYATVRLVPDDYPLGINQAIDAAVDGDVVSVWIHTVPPDTYRENVNFDGKSITIVNRSFLSGGGTGYDSSWDHVVIDGSGSDSSVVRMTGSLSHVPRVVLKGFTITGGRSAYGGGIYCENVDFLDKGFGRCEPLLLTGLTGLRANLGLGGHQEIAYERPAASRSDSVSG